MSLVIEPFIVTRHKVLLFSNRNEPGIVFFIMYNDLLIELVD